MCTGNFDCPNQGYDCDAKGACLQVSCVGYSDCRSSLCIIKEEETTGLCMQCSPDATEGEDTFCVVPENYVGDIELTTATCAENFHCVFKTESDSGISSGAVIAIIILIISLIACLIVVVKFMCGKKPDDAMVGHVAYSNMDNQDDI